MPDLEFLRRFGLVLEMAEAAGDGDWAAWTKVFSSAVGIRSDRAASTSSTLPITLATPRPVRADVRTSGA